MPTPAERQRKKPDNEQLLKLYWNRAGVKRELNNLRSERYELLDKLKEQESAIERAQEQLQGLERLLTNPLAAANAMVYFQLRHLWRVASLRLVQFATELHAQRQRRERAQLEEAAMAKRKRRLAAVHERLDEITAKRTAVIKEVARLEQELAGMNRLIRLFKGPALRRQVHGARQSRKALEDRVDEFNDLIEKIEDESIPEPEGLTLQSRRIINTAIISFAQNLVVHFHEHDLASLAKEASHRPVADMKFGDRKECDRMVERIRERIEDLRQDKTLADQVKQRADALLPDLQYLKDTDSVPTPDSVEQIKVTAKANGMARRASDTPLHINVLADDYWDLYSILR